MTIPAELDWDLVAETAKALGVGAEALKKWKQRGVPHRWRLRLIRETDGRIPPEAFEDRETAA